MPIYEFTHTGIDRLEEKDDDDGDDEGKTSPGPKKLGAARRREVEPEPRKVDRWASD